MTVAEYLNAEGIKAAEFARRLGVPRMLVCRWAKGAHPRGPHIQRLIDGTGGKVTLADLSRAAEKRKADAPAEDAPAADTEKDAAA